MLKLFICRVGNTSVSGGTGVALTLLLQGRELELILLSFSTGVILGIELLLF